MPDDWMPGQAYQSPEGIGEWVVEAALQRWDYVPVAPTTAPIRGQRVGGEV